MEFGREADDYQSVKSTHTSESLFHRGYKRRAAVHMDVSTEGTTNSTTPNLQVAIETRTAHSSQHIHHVD